MEKVLTDRQEKELAMMTNMYYMLLTAADQVLYKTEDYFAAMGVVMVGKKKVRHRLITAQFNVMKNLMEDVENDYRATFGEETWGVKWDEIRRSGAYLARICALILDRCKSEEVEGEREKRIERYIYMMPENGCCDDQFLKRFFIR